MHKRPISGCKVLYLTGFCWSFNYSCADCGDLITMTGRVGVDEDLLKKECSENSLKKIAPLLPDWLTYAKALAFTEPETRDITDNPQLSNSTHAMKALRVLEKWHRRHAFNATYHHLVKVCLDLGHLTIATEICKMVKGWSHFS